MENNEGELLRKYLRAKGLNQEDFAATLGMSRQGLGYHFRKEKLDYEFKQLLRQHGVQLFDENGRLANAGGMAEEPGNAQYINFGEQLLMYVPLVNQYAYAGYLSGYADEEYVERLPKIPFLVDREYKGTYRCFEVRGDSMDDGSVDSYLPGDKVLGRQIAQAHWQNKLHIRKWDFIIVHKTEGILIKKILEHETEAGILKLHSLNPLYEDLTIHLRDVIEIYNVVQVARKK